MELAEAAAMKLEQHSKSLSDVIPFFHYVVSSVRVPWTHRAEPWSDARSHVTGMRYGLDLTYLASRPASSPQRVSSEPAACAAGGQTLGQLQPVSRVSDRFTSRLSGMGASKNAPRLQRVVPPPPACSGAALRGGVKG